MASYKVLIKPSAAKDIEAVASIKDRRRIVRPIRDLADDPRPLGREKLSAQDKYRVRQGSFRIVYGIEDDALIVYVVKVGYRRDIYR